MPRILIKGYANDEHLGETPCLCLDIDYEMARRWLDRIEKVKAIKASDDDVCSLDFWEYAGEFFDLYSLDSLTRNASPDTEEALRKAIDETVEALEGEEIVTLAEDSPLAGPFNKGMEKSSLDGGLYIRTESDRLEVMEDRAYRCAYVKHTNIRVETVTLTKADLEKYL